MPQQRLTSEPPHRPGDTLLSRHALAFTEFGAASNLSLRQRRAELLNAARSEAARSRRAITSRVERRVDLAERRLEKFGQALAAFSTFERRRGAANPQVRSLLGRFETQLTAFTEHSTAKLALSLRRLASSIGETLPQLASSPGQLRTLASALSSTVEQRNQTAGLIAPHLSELHAALAGYNSQQEPLSAIHRKMIAKDLAQSLPTPRELSAQQSSRLGTDVTAELLGCVLSHTPEGGLNRARVAEVVKRFRGTELASGLKFLLGEYIAAQEQVLRRRAGIEGDESPISRNSASNSHSATPEPSFQRALELRRQSHENDCPEPVISLTSLMGLSLAITEARTELRHTASHLSRHLGVSGRLAWQIARRGTETTVDELRKVFSADPAERAYQLAIVEHSRRLLLNPAALPELFAAVAEFLQAHPRESMIAAYSPLHSPERFRGRDSIAEVVQEIASLKETPSGQRKLRYMHAASRIAKKLREAKVEHGDSEPLAALLCGADLGPKGSDLSEPPRLQLKTWIATATSRTGLIQQIAPSRAQELFAIAARLGLVRRTSRSAHVYALASTGPTSKSRGSALTQSILKALEGAIHHEDTKFSQHEPRTTPTAAAPSNAELVAPATASSKLRLKPLQRADAALKRLQAICAKLSTHHSALVAFIDKLPAALDSTKSLEESLDKLQAALDSKEIPPRSELSQQVQAELDKRLATKGLITTEGDAPAPTLPNGAPATKVLLEEQTEYVPTLLETLTHLRRFEIERPLNDALKLISGALTDAIALQQALKSRDLALYNTGLWTAKLLLQIDSTLNSDVVTVMPSSQQRIVRRPPLATAIAAMKSLVTLVAPENLAGLDPLQSAATYASQLVAAASTGGAAPELPAVLEAEHGAALRCALAKATGADFSANLPPFEPDNVSSTSTATS